MRQNYTCVCDCCENIIELANDENDVSLNSAKYVFCNGCYGILTSWFDGFLFGGGDRFRQGNE